jgi:hypothetical protein
MSTSSMVAGEQIEWRRGFPRRQVRMLGGCAAAAALLVALAWALFGDEPATLNTGAANPLAVIPQWTLVAAAAVVCAAVVPVLRRPKVAASHVTLYVRPGMFRTLTLPWTAIAEATGVATRDGEFLLIRLGHRDGDVRPGFWDRTVLRAATRAYPTAAGYDLAVRLRDFTGTPAAKMAALAAYAPESVEITSRL